MADRLSRKSCAPVVRRLAQTAALLGLAAAIGIGWSVRRGLPSFQTAVSSTYVSTSSQPAVEEVILESTAEPEPGDTLPLSLPAGYTAERIAAHPLIKHPMFACFDDRGRLYVACSTGTNLDPQARSADPPDMIRRLEDRDGDGRFERSVVFADRLTFPQGILWHDGAIYTASPPSLWKLEDRDGDGVADHREELATGFPFTGIADDMHGPSLGPDGRIYWGTGRFPHEIRKPGGPVIHQGSSPLILRCRTDGSELEVFSAAMGNPVKLAFSDEGEPFASGTFFAPVEMGVGLRDAVIHCVEGGVYPVRGCEFFELNRTGPLLPAVAQLGLAAVSGITRGRGPAFGGDATPILYAAQFNTHSVPRLKLKREGSTFAASIEQFLESEASDFHPTDVVEDADGSLLVIDTGAWFKHCPTSQIDRQNVFGGIYRIRPQAASKTEDPWGKAIAWDHLDTRGLTERLDDPRFAVQDKAVARLSAAGAKAIPALSNAIRKGRTALSRRNAVWALGRIDAPAAREAANQGLSDADAGVRTAAAHVAGLNRDPRAVARLETICTSDVPAARREAATALGRIGRPGAVPALLAAVRGTPDRFVEHAAIDALIRLDDPEATRNGLTASDPSQRRAAVVALIQMNHGGLTPGLAAGVFDRSDPDLQDAVMGVLGSRPEFATLMAGVLRGWLQRPGLSGPRLESTRRVLMASCRDRGVQDMVGGLLAARTTPTASRLLLLEVIGQAPVTSTPQTWHDALAKVLAENDERLLEQALTVYRSKPLMSCDAAVQRLGGDRRRPAHLRVAALDAYATRLVRLDVESFHLLIASLDSEAPPLQRLSAARALGRASLDDEQLLTLAGVIHDLGALVLPRILPAFGKSRNPAVGARLVAALGSSPGFRSLSADALQHSLKDYPEEIQRQAEPLSRELNLEVEEKSKILETLLPQVANGDPRRGHDVFLSARASCSTCHSVGSEGGHVGPDLTNIGKIRTDRDLLEAIVFPSSSFARGFEPYQIATHDGRVFSGIIKRENADALFLTGADRLETVIPRQDVELIEPATESVMPRGLDANLSRTELADLIAFLKALR